MGAVEGATSSIGAVEGATSPIGAVEGATSSMVAVEGFTSSVVAIEGATSSIGADEGEDSSAEVIVGTVLAGRDILADFSAEQRNEFFRNLVSQEEKGIQFIDVNGMKVRFTVELTEEEKAAKEAKNKAAAAQSRKANRKRIAKVGCVILLIFKCALYAEWFSWFQPFYPTDMLLDGHSTPDRSRTRKVYLIGAVLFELTIYHNPLCNLCYCKQMAEALGGVVKIGITIMNEKELRERYHYALGPLVSVTAWDVVKHAAINDNTQAINLRARVIEAIFAEIVSSLFNFFISNLTS
jgi:hypothetical protein